MKLLFTILSLFAMTTVVQAQSPIDEIIKDWERAKAYTKEYLDAMPAESYGLKPTPEMRSFAQQLLHLIDANYRLASAATGVASPVVLGESEKTADQSKENVTKLVMAGYEFVINSVKTMTPAQLSEPATLFGRIELTKGKALEKCFEHQTHHRGQTTVYIRMAGATPPQEKLF